MLAALVAVSPSRQSMRPQKRTLPKAIVYGDDMNDQDDQATHHPKVCIHRSTNRPIDKLYHNWSEVDKNDDELQRKTPMIVSTPMDHCQSGDVEAMEEQHPMYNDILIDWDDDLSDLFMFKEGDDAIC